jgi:GNAT superfamily N-acetyltransferase
VSAATADAAPVVVRGARLEDLPGLVACIADDTVGGHGDVWTAATQPLYEAAFAEIAASGRDVLLVAEAAGEIAGVAHLTLSRIIADRGALAAQVRTVFVRRAWRGRGVGAAVMGEAERIARERGAYALALVSNKKRADAHRFYKRLGYARSHESFRKRL